MTEGTVEQERRAAADVAARMLDQYDETTTLLVALEVAENTDDGVAGDVVAMTLAVMAAQVELMLLHLPAMTKPISVVDLQRLRSEVGQ